MKWKPWSKNDPDPVPTVGVGARPNPFGVGARASRGGWWSRIWSGPRRPGHERDLRSPEQLEMILGAVKPVRNSLVDDDLVVVRRKADSRLIYESLPSPTARPRVEEESDRAWQRLRGRRLDHLKVSVD